MNRALRGALPRGRRARGGPRGGARGRGGSPKLSIVVPVYNVERYLAECLDSVLAQPYVDREVVMVDDGSTDSSGDIAARYAAQHPDFRLVSQANAGLGAARNAGIGHARGEYLTFLDSDDRLPEDAYSAMMRTLEDSGSDLAIGMLKRDEAGRRYAMPRMRDNHRSRRVAVTLDEMPRILADVFAVNKVFRRSFWDAAGLEFPVDIRYEDQPTLTRAFLAAGTFDVLRQTVYLWRIRHDGSSITQRRHDIADLRDRIVTKRVSTEALVDKAPHLLPMWLADILPVDMWEYFRAVPGCSDEYWAMLRSAVAELWSEDTVPFDRTWIPVQQRLMGWYVARDRRADLERLLDFVDSCGGDVPVEVRGGHVVALLPGVHDPGAGLPPSVSVLGDHELRWESRITSATWDGGRLRVRGFALIRNVPTEGQPTELTARLMPAAGSAAGREAGSAAGREAGREAGVDLAVTAERQPRATKFAGRPSQNFDDCGFSCAIDVSALLAVSPPFGVPDRGEPAARSWRFSFERRVAGIRLGGGVTSFDRPDVDRSWHEITGTAGAVLAEARLREVDDELVLDVRPTATRTGT
jgi:glycosyltransferase involved in cell wall biosynthesis